MTNDLRHHGAAAFIVAVALSVLAGVHMTHGTFDDQITTTADYANDGSFTIALLFGAFAITALLALGAPKLPVRLAAAGQALVSVGVVAGLITGESPGWFAVVAVPGLLAWLGSTIRLAVWAWRAGALPKPLALGIAVLMPTTVILAEIGGSAIAALVWFALAVRWLGARETRTAGRPATATAGTATLP
jgi:hypothetical protein